MDYNRELREFSKEYNRKYSKYTRFNKKELENKDEKSNSSEHEFIVIDGSSNPESNFNQYS